MQPVAHERIGLAHHPRPRIVAHALHGCLGGQARQQRFFEPPPPAAVVRQHTEGLQHLPVLARARHVTAIEHTVDHARQLVDGLLEAPSFELKVLGDELGDDDARFVQHDVTEGNAFGDRHTGKTLRGLSPRLRRDLLGDAQAARGQHLGKHHGRGLQRLDFLIAIGSVRAVLHRQHADGIAPAQDRHAEEGVVDVLARLRVIGEGWMALSVGKLQSFGLLGDQANETFAAPHMRVVNRLPVQAFGGEELKRAVAAPQIERADLGHHVRGDQRHHLVEATLRAFRLRHDLAQAAEQLSRSANSESHKSTSSPARWTANHTSQQVSA